MTRGPACACRSNSESVRRRRILGGGAAGAVTADAGGPDYRLPSNEPAGALEKTVLVKEPANAEAKEQTPSN
jgi:hypothetical protein